MSDTSIPDFVVTAIRSVRQQHGNVAAIKLTRAALTSDWKEYHYVEYHAPFRVGKLNKPTLLWCREYVLSL